MIISSARKQNRASFKSKRRLFESDLSGDLSPYLSYHYAAGCDRKPLCRVLAYWPSHAYAASSICIVAYLGRLGVLSYASPDSQRIHARNEI